MEHRRAFGRRVRELREAAGLSQEAFAERAGVHTTYVGSIERGERNISIDNIVRIAAALSVSPAVLLEPGDAPSRTRRRTGGP